MPEPELDFNDFKRHCETETIESAMLEDLYSGDITTEATVPDDHKSKGVIRAKSSGVIAGVRVAQVIFSMSKNPITFSVRKKDGDRVSAGDVVAEAVGKTETLLVCERTALNFMQRMSGIATKTAAFVELIKDTDAKLLDTRKTAPGLRFFDKEAVKIGGGTNHRVGLFDMMLIKDNHVDASGGVQEAIRRAKEYRKRKLLDVKIEVEVRSMDELQAALPFAPEIIMLDNFSVDELKKAVALVRAKKTSVQLEASGGVSKDTIRAIAETGVDFISVGELTHSVTAMDISMKISPITATAP
jgi:nicotinate-nucleotide pyrophosphorylase (carboxylating)